MQQSHQTTSGVVVAMTVSKINGQQPHGLTVFIGCVKNVCLIMLLDQKSQQAAPHSTIQQNNCWIQSIGSNPQCPRKPATMPPKVAFFMSSVLSHTTNGVGPKPGAVGSHDLSCQKSGLSPQHRVPVFFPRKDLVAMMKSFS